MSEHDPRRYCIGGVVIGDRSDESEREEWSLGNYVGTCPNCGRERLCECPNGKRRCEKCNWVPELNDYCPYRLDA